MSIELVWAMGENGAIGLNNAIPWRLPKDMAFFKQRTLNKTIIMGRRTWESFGGKPLPQRRNIVITRDLDYKVEQAEVVHTIEEGLSATQGEELCVIGGSEIYREFLPFADRLVVTKIHEHFEADTFFPNIDWSEWELVEQIEGEQDEKNIYPYTFEFYERKK
ncbi:MULTISPECIES: dihydrofolate reductase [Paenibacillus]|uniref:dihydrofolate reductase n=1 Tax=Paenibacillus TaxID=44249 RepID=UPI001F462941|nr:dihydrofolate reductase [Paenibacillus sp. JJ-223]CAH1190897.1 IS1595 family transposase ISSsu9 [Paenibacillus sp. JJ-223]